MTINSYSNILRILILTFFLLVILIQNTTAEGVGGKKSKNRISTRKTSIPDPSKWNAISQMGSKPLSVSSRTVNLPIAYDSVAAPLQDLSAFLQPDDILDGNYDFIQDDGVICAGDCNLRERGRICYYRLIVEQYSVMGPACDGCPENLNECFKPQCVTADGIEKSIVTANRRIPGPTINVCYKDRIVVDVENRLPSQSTTMHFHGFHQEDTPWADGAEYVTQCPIDEGQTYRYDFYADNSGTLFWHSHGALQMLDGLEGVLTVRMTDEEEELRHLYDYDLNSHTIFIQDWMHELSLAHDPGYNVEPPSLLGNHARSYLINGRGSYTDANGKNTGTPLTVFNVKPNLTYRFRIVAGTSLPCPIIVTIESHYVKVIATDSYPLRTAKKVGSMFLAAAERFDVTLTTNQPVGTYWIRVHGEGINCEGHGLAILKYEGSDHDTPKSDSNIPILYPILNDLRYGCDKSNSSALCLNQLESLYTAPSMLTEAEPNYRITLNLGASTYQSDNLFADDIYRRWTLPVGGPDAGGVLVVDTFNNITNRMPPFSLLTQDDPIPEELVCPAQCGDPVCECLHYYKIPLHHTVEIIYIDDTSAPGAQFIHPAHLHGYAFRVIYQGTAEERKNMDYYINNISEKRPVVKDTVGVMSGGFTAIRFWATNPGLWMTHCHYNIHNRYGMACILQIGERWEFVPQPPGLPKCGNYIPSI